MKSEFVYSSLFRLLPQSFKVSKVDFIPNGRTPAYSSVATNNGRLGFVDREPLFCVTEETPVYLVFGDHTRTMNIVREDFCVMDNVKVMVPKFRMSDEILLYIITAWKKSIPNLGYARHWSVAKGAKFELPVVASSDPSHEYTVDDIDWQYMQESIDFLMQKCVAELEQEHIREIAAYMRAAGLESYELDAEDIKVLSSRMSFQEFKIGDIFSRVSAKCKKSNFDKRNDTSTIPDDEFCIPLVNAKVGDNGIMFYGRESDWETQEMCIDIIQNGAVATGTVYAQPNPVAVLWDAYLIKPLAEVSSEKILLYLSKCIEKITKENFSYDNKATWGKVKECHILLPVDSAGAIDFNYMKCYIRAIEKLAIIDIFNRKSKVVETAKNILEGKIIC